MNGAKKLERLIVEELKELEMKNAKIKFEISSFSESDFEQCFTKNGANNVEIVFSANLGEELKPLNKVVSGGELSRLMLAIKTIFAPESSLFTLSETIPRSVTKPTF